MNAAWDVHDNVVREIADDPFEPARAAGWRIWGNRIERTKTVLSTGSPTANGALYFFRNVVWRTGTAGLARDYDGGPAGGQNGMVFKYDGLAAPGTQARIYVLHNTVWTDRPETYTAANAGGGGTRPPGFYLRDNIFRVGDRAFDYYANPQGAYDEAANQFTTANPARGMRRAAPTKQDSPTFDAYRADSGQGAGSNAAIGLHDVALLDAQFLDAPSGDLRLRDGSLLRRIGLPVPNLSDPTPDRQAADAPAPNLGAFPW
jgi:hypothetical protein